jgi:tetratricopeptide (TPR) repeat protein
MSRSSLIFLCTLFMSSIVLPALPLYAHQDLLLQIEQLDAQISKDPQNTELLIRRGDLYRRHGDWSAAEADFQMVRKIAPDHATIDFFEGRLLVTSGENEKGIVLLTRQLEQNAQHSGAYQVRAEAHWNLHQPLLAARDYQLAINTSTRASPSLYRSLVLSLVAAGREYSDEAITAVDDGLNHFAGEISLLGLGVDVSLSQKKPLRAERYLEKVPSRLRMLPQWQFRQAILVCVQGDEGLASERLSSILTGFQGNAPQKAGTWEPPMDVLSGLVANSSADECSRAAWEMLLKQQP